MTVIAMSVLIPAAQAAGAAILEVYNSDFAVERKEDRSPLTLADRRSHEILSAALEKGVSLSGFERRGQTYSL